ncbi:MAG: M14 family zinc carboxypeptidase, partial [Armatimonadota bacterium]
MSQTPRAGPAQHSGNGAIISIARQTQSWEVVFASEPRTSPQPLWFHIEVTDLRGAPVVFAWENADLTLGNRNELHLLRPVLRADGGSWRRSEGVEVVALPDGRRQVRFEHPGGAESVAAAFCYPYGPPELEAALADVGDAWSASPIGITGEGRTLMRLRLAGREQTPRPGLYLLARQHAGETPGSWVLDGILRLLAGESDEAAAIREQLECWAVPFVDLDGVANGDYGKDALPWDFNRAWEPLPMRPEVQALQRDLLRFAERTEPRLLLDLHAPGHSTPDVYAQLPREQRPQEQQEAARGIAAELAAAFPELAPEDTAQATTYASRWNALATVASWAWDRLDNTPGITVETSYQRLAGEPLTPEGYRE